MRLEDATSGYGLVLLVQARTVKGRRGWGSARAPREELCLPLTQRIFLGVCNEMQGNIKAATEAYEGAWNVVEQYNDEKSPMLLYWIEESLYRGSLLYLRSGYVDSKSQTGKFSKLYAYLY